MTDKKKIVFIKIESVHYHKHDEVAMIASQNHYDICARCGRTRNEHDLYCEDPKQVHEPDEAVGTHTTALSACPGFKLELEAA